MDFFPYKNKSHSDTDVIYMDYPVNKESVLQKHDWRLNSMNWWICDDHPESVSGLIEVLESAEENVSAVFSSPDRMLNELRETDQTKRPQGIFLDIDFDQRGKGLDIAGCLREIDPSLPVIFITAYPEKYAQMILLKYEQPFGYLTKPFSRQMVLLYLEKMKNRKQNESYLSIQFKRKDYHIRMSSIIYLESDRHVPNIITENGEYRTYERLSELLERLDEDFAPCHKSFIVNLKFVECFEGNFIHMITGQEIPVSRSLKNKVKDAFYDYLDTSFCKI